MADYHRGGVLGEQSPGSGGAQDSCRSTKGHLKGKSKTSDDTRRRHKNQGGQGGYTGDGGRITRLHHLGLAGYWSSGQGRQGGGVGVVWKEAGRGRKGPLDGRTLGPIGTWEQVEDGKGEVTGRGKTGTGLREELLWAAQNGREVHKGSGGRQAGAPSRWKVALQPGDMGEGRRG